jgi:cytochrome c oxidase subunit 4
VVVVERHDYGGVLEPNRDQRALLALRRHRLDLPVPAPVPDWAARTLMSSHILPKRVYYTIFAILLFCTYLTVQIAFLDLGAMNTVAALVIATFKATIVVLFFMHVKYSTRLTWAVVIGSVFWLGILLSLTLSDYLTRVWRTYG